MTGPNVDFEQRDRVCVVRFDGGDRRNAFSSALLQAMIDAARRFERDARTSAVVLTGRPEVFSMGFDLNDARAVGALPFDERRNAMALGARMCDAWGAVEPVVIAAVEGWCVGGGVALAGACDLRIAAEGSTFYVPEIERGMNLAWGAVPKLVALCGPARTKRLIIAAEQVGAAQAVAWGLADEVAPRGGALEAALAYAQRIAAMPPVQVRMIKQSVDAAAFALARAVSALDRDQFLLAQTSGDHAEAIAAFLEKRAPRYAGR